MEIDVAPEFHDMFMKSESISSKLSCLLEIFRGEWKIQQTIEESSQKEILWNWGR